MLLQKGRRLNPFVRPDSYKPTTFRWWVVDVKTIDNDDNSLVAYMKNGSALFRCYFDDVNSAYLQVYAIIDLPIPNDKEENLLRLISKHNHRAIGSKFNIIKGSKENSKDFLISVQFPIFKELFSEAYLCKAVSDVNYNVDKIFKDLLLLLTKDESSGKNNVQ